MLIRIVREDSQSIYDCHGVFFAELKSTDAGYEKGKKNKLIRMFTVDDKPINYIVGENWFVFLMNNNGREIERLA